jgi:aspartyl-tRNA synthetase
MQESYHKRTLDSLETNENVIVEGWLHKKRDHGGLLFWEIRRGLEILQVVFHQPEKQATIPIESVVRIKGRVINRAEEQKNLRIKNGAIELIAHSYEIISESIPCPFYPNENVSEEQKSIHRVLYLRSKKMQELLLNRSNLIFFVHQMMQEWGFILIQTPLLTVSSPEGARDFIIPSRLHKGKFYALPQAPQIFKQLLMCAGISKYYQIAPCFRDEAARSTRLYGEFYQIDFEMSFIEEKEVIHILEQIVKRLLEKFCNKPIIHRTMTYAHAMENYGSDKPDLRNPLILEDFTDIFSHSGMKIFSQLIERGSLVKGIRVKKFMSKSEMEKCLDFALKNGFRVAYVSHGENLEGPIAKFLPSNICDKGETVFFICDKDQLYERCNLIREYLGKQLSLIEDTMALLTVLDFPMFEIKEEVEFKHNPFSKIKSFHDDLEKITAHQYDLVLNGVEIASGSVRENDWTKLIENFGIAGYSPESVQSKFKVLIDSFKYGCPPHGGAAIGIERLLMIIFDEPNVRETVAFPLNTNGQDLSSGAPSYLEESFLKELGIFINLNDSNL